MPSKPLALVFVLAAVLPGQEAPPVVSPAEKLALEIAEQVAKSRALPWKEPPKVGVFTEDELRAYVLAMLDKEWPEARWTGQARAFKAFGLIPADYDLKASMVALLAEQIGGFYDPETKQLKLIDRSRSPEKGAKSLGALAGDTDRVVMAHELVHALQDQHFDLKGLPLDRADEDDLALASSAVAEGDATLGMLAVMIGDRGEVAVDALFKRGQFLSTMLKLLGDVAIGITPGMEEFKKAPPVLKEALVFPYMGGLELCLKAGAGGANWKGVDGLYRNPPTSSEQVLHPEKVLGSPRDEPQGLTLPPLAAHLGEGARRLAVNTHGELVTRILLEQALKKKDAARAAAGWGGDRFEAWERPGQPDALVWLTTWDDEDEADAFAAALTTWLDKRHQGDTAAEADWAARLYEREGLADLIGRRGAEVALLLAVPRGPAPKILRALFEDTQRRVLVARTPKDAPR